MINPGCGNREKLVIVLAIGLCVAATDRRVLAQSTYIWDATGVSQLWGDGGNWVGGVGPNLAGGVGTSDSAIFSAGTNTTVKLPDNSNGVPVQNITFDSSAPAYSFINFADNPGNDIEMLLGSITNQSSHTQDFTGIPDIYLDSNALNNASVIATGGDVSTNLGFKFNNILYSNGGGFPMITGAFNTTITNYTGLSATQTLYKEGAGTLFISGTGGTNASIGRLAIGTSDATVPGPMGAVRINANDSLGAGGSVASSGSYTQIYGNVNSDGRLELTNNITTNEGIIINGRGDGSIADGGTMPYNNALNPAIVNVSGNNTMTGPFTFSGGGGAYNFASTSGLLTITSNLNVTASSDRGITFQGAGDGLFSGNITGSGTNVSNTITKYGSGTLTLGGSANNHIAFLAINGGTLALGASAAISFAPTTDLGVVPQVVVASGATFDVSAQPGGTYTLTQPLLGSGSVNGSLVMTAGTTVQPGDHLVGDVLYFAGSQAVGQLSLHNGLDLSAGSQMVWNLGALSTASAGTNFDQLVVSGPLTLGGSSSLSIDLSLLAGGSQPGGGDPFWNSSHTWTIISNSNNPGSSNFASIVNGVVATGTFTTSVSAGTLLGDVNGDHVVNGLDIAVVASHWLLTGATLGQGDANGDGTVNGLDIALIASHWLSTGGGSGGGILLTYTPSAGGGTAVPEPSTVVLAACGLIGLVTLRRRGHRLVARH